MALVKSDFAGVENENKEKRNDNDDGMVGELFIFHWWCLLKRNESIGMGDGVGKSCAVNFFSFSQW